ncbi:GspH/FimT family pseudopilin [Pseudomonas sp. S36]|uniref:GspH/FimT family pseudopilin n=1 Tax=Pseudomonas sp. S36 TaxID=2767447 RepID=UPI0019134DAE|nr:GspH/FimT family pseudopilin [Pseudomonas sp. S36]MBK4989243.1 type IV pili biogenesis protein FimT [Pseudomonas sp. S36]
MKQRGVTLIQMLSALAIAMLLAQLGMPAYATFSDDLHRAAAARDLAQALRSARGHAMLQGQPVRVQALDNAWGNGWVVMLEHNGQVLREHRLPRPLRIAGNIGATLRFSAVGIPMRPGGGWLGGTLDICERGTALSRHQVVLASSGRVRVATEVNETPQCRGS